MAMVYRRLNDPKKLILHFSRLIEAKKFNSMICVIMVTGNVLIKIGNNLIFSILKVSRSKS